MEELYDFSQLTSTDDKCSHDAKIRYRRKTVPCGGEVDYCRGLTQNETKELGLDPFLYICILIPLFLLLTSCFINSSILQLFVGVAMCTN